MLAESEANANNAYRAYEAKLMSLEALLEDQKYVYEQQLIALQRELLEEQDNLRVIEDRLIQASTLSAAPDPQLVILQSILDTERSNMVIRESLHHEEVSGLKSEISKLALQLDQAISDLSSLRSKMLMEKQAVEDELILKLDDLQAAFDQKEQMNVDLQELMRQKEEEFQLQYELLIESQAVELNELLMAAAAEAADAAIEASVSSTPSPPPDPRGKLKKSLGKVSSDAALKAAHASEIHRLTKTHSADVDKFRRKYEDKVKALEAERDMAVKTLSLKVDGTVKEAGSNQATLKLQREHAQAIENLVTDHQKSMRGERSSSLFCQCSLTS